MGEEEPRREHASTPNLTVGFPEDDVPGAVTTCTDTVSPFQWRDSEKKTRQLAYLKGGPHGMAEL